jgi:uncharacterized protein (TIGR00369 family)
MVARTIEWYNDNAPQPLTSLRHGFELICHIDALDQQGRAEVTWAQVAFGYKKSFCHMVYICINTKHGSLSSKESFMTSHQDQHQEPLKAMEERLKHLFPGLLGIEWTKLDPEHVQARLLVRAELCTVGNSLHGGAFMALADTVGAVATFIQLPKGARTTTIESKTNFMRGAPVGSFVQADTRPLHRGRSTHVWETRITDEAGKLCATVTQTQMVLLQ